MDTERPKSNEGKEREAAIKNIRIKALRKTGYHMQDSAAENRTILYNDLQLPINQKNKSFRKSL